MILRIAGFENDIATSDHYVRVLEISDKALFANIIQSLYSLCSGYSSKEYIVLVDGEKQVDFNKDVIFERDILGIDFNNRKILTQLYAVIKGQVKLDLEIKEKIEIYFQDVFNLLDMTLIDLPFEVNYDPDIEIEDILKLFKIKIQFEDQSFLERILCFIDLIALLDLGKLVIFCNLKSFFTDAEIEEIYKHIITNKLKVLLIEGIIAPRALKYEKKTSIDDEFDDFELN